MSKATDAAWAAGFFDGEGHSQAMKVRNQHYLVLTVVQVDRRALDRFQKIVGCGQIYGPSLTGRMGPNRSPRHDWKATSRENVIKVMKVLWPYLGPAKREQFETAREKLQMPKYFNNVRPDSRPWNPIAKISPLDELPGVVSPPPDAPYPAADGAGDGAAKSERLVPKISGYSTNVPQPDNTQAPSNASGDGKNGMAG